MPSLSSAVKKKSTLALFAAVSIALAGCQSAGDSASDKDSESKDSLALVATTTQLCDYVSALASGDDSKVSLERTDASGNTKHIGADKGDDTANLDLTCLLAPNASAHEHEMTAQQMDALAHADMFLTSGIDLEHFLDSAVEASGFKGEMLVSTGYKSSNDVDDLEAEKAKEKDLPYTINRGDQKVELAEWPFPPEEGEEAEFRFDPHVWTSPRGASVQVHNVAHALVEKEKERNNEAAAEALQDRADKLEETLKNLDQWVKDSIATVPEENRVLFSSHDAFGYFSNHYGIEFIGAALSDFSDQHDATSQHIQDSVDAVKASNTKVLFAENSNSSKSIEAIARAAGVKAVIGEDALYGDSLGVEGSDGATYVGAIVHNVKNLVTNWGGTPAPLPDDVKAEATRA